MAERFVLVNTGFGLAVRGTGRSGAPGQQKEVLAGVARLAQTRRYWLVGSADLATKCHSARLECHLQWTMGRRYTAERVLQLPKEVLAGWPRLAAAGL